MKTRNTEFDHFDSIVVSRLFAADFAQPKQNDFDFYRNKSIAQIKCAISNITRVNTQHELITSIAQAHAFIEAAHNLEFINLTEKDEWSVKVTKAYTDAVLEA